MSAAEEVHTPTVFRERRQQAIELGLWPKGNDYEATEQRAELARVGFYDYADSRWETHVAQLRKERTT
jgi:hypothetical protein